jgi:CHAT domain-containing protein
MRTAATNVRQNDALARNYVFQKSADEAWYDKHGKFQQHTSKREVLGVGQGIYEQVIELDGKPISEEERARHERRIGRAASVYDLQYNSPAGPLRHSFDFSQPFENDSPLFNIRMLGVEAVRGRPAYMIEATLAADADPAKTERSVLTQEAKVWIDIQDLIPVRVHLTWGPGRAKGLGSSIMDGSAEMEWQKIDDEVWLPSRDFLKWHWKLSRFSLMRYAFGHGGDVRGELELISVNFRRFTVETRIAQEASRLAQESSIRREAPLPEPSQAAEEVAIRSVVQRIIAAYMQKDSRSLFSLFTADSPNLFFLKMKIESGWAMHQTAERKNFTIGDIEVRSDSATVRVSYQLTAATGADERSGQSFLTLELAREQDGWKLSDLFPDGLELAEELAAAESDDELDRLLTAEKPRVTQELVEVLVAHGNELMAMGQYDAAKAYFNTARRVAQQLHDREALAWALYGLAHGSLAQGHEPAAADYYQQALAICDAAGDKSLLAAAFSYIGQDYAELGDYRQALEYYQKSIITSEQAVHREFLAITLASVGDVFALQGNDDQALDYYERSLKLFNEFGKTLGSVGQAALAETLGNLGEALTRKGNYARALEHYQKSLQLSEDNPFGAAAGILRRMGDNAFLQGHADEALDYYQKSLAQYEELDHKTGAAAALGRIANVYYKKGELNRSIAFGTRARAIASELENPSDLSSILTTLGKAYLANTQYDEAREALTEAISAVEKMRRQVVGTEHDQALFFERKVDPYDAMVGLLVKEHCYAEAFEYAERAKGRVLLNILHNGRKTIAKTLTPEQRAQEQSLNQVLATLNSELQRENQQRRPNSAVVRSIEAQLKTARLQYEAFETELYALHPNLKTQRGETSPRSVENLQTLLSRPGTAFLEYVVEQERTYLFVLKRGPGDGQASSVNVHVIEISAQDLAKLSTDFRAKLASNSLDFRELARRLYDLLLAPAEKELAGTRTVCLVPAGSLWEVPFQALVSSRNRYLLEDYALFYVPSLSVLYEMRNRAADAFYEHLSGMGDPDSSLTNESDGAPNKAASAAAPSSLVLFAVGNPELKHNDRSRTGTNGQVPYAPLPKQEQVMRTLRRIYGSKNSTVLTGQAASEETVKAEAGKYEILHFSTHGTLDNDNPLYSSLLLTSASAQEDGLLEAREIMQLNLHANLAVLSACDTALGQVRSGEGLIGMSWALFVAGTPTTVVSQWQVDSASTARLMMAFHRKVKSQLLPPALQVTPAGLKVSVPGVLLHPIALHHFLKSTSSEQLSLPGWEITKAEVLREAALKLMSEPQYRHPFYWAGFVVMGDGL